MRRKMGFAVFVVGLLGAVLGVESSTSFLAINGTVFSYGGKSPVFLSGANMPWINYGNDFGNNQTQGHRCALQSYIQNVSAAGGNSIRIWLFVEGASIPEFDSAGRVTATDKSGTLVAELQSLLQFAARKNVFVILTLWNGALMRQPQMKNLIYDTAKLQTFIDNALVPLVTGLKDEPALAAYELMNEPEGSVDPSTKNAEPCFDTTILQGSGAGWAGGRIPMQELLRFFNLQAGAIKRVDSKALVTVGAWSQHSSTDKTVSPGQKYFNYYKDECLIKAGKDQAGVLDFSQIHTYAHNQGKFDPGSPFGTSIKAASDYALAEPIVIGEFSAGSTKGRSTIQALYGEAFARSFSGAWDWSMAGGDGNDDGTEAMKGMNSLRSEDAVHVHIDSSQGPALDCDCSDDPPPGSYTCAQQAGWGKCGFPFMHGYCCRSCHGCRGCK